MSGLRWVSFPKYVKLDCLPFKPCGSPLYDIDSMSIHFGGLRIVLLHNASKDTAGIGGKDDPDRNTRALLEKNFLRQYHSQSWLAPHKARCLRKPAYSKYFLPSKMRKISVNAWAKMMMNLKLRMPTLKVKHS
jgi:hypothetical protein